MSAELCNLKTTDIDNQCMMVHIRQGKGGHDRNVPLSQKLLQTLRVYWRWMKPKTYLFPGSVHNWRADVPIKTKVPWEACRQAAHRAGVTKHVSPHTLPGTLADAQPIWAQTWTITKVVDNTTACPGSQGVFNTATLFPAISGPWVVFLDSGDDSCTSNDGPSIWSYNLITKALVKLVDTNTLIPFPAGAGNFVGPTFPLPVLRLSM